MKSLFDFFPKKDAMTSAKRKAPVVIPSDVASGVSSAKKKKLGSLSSSDAAAQVLTDDETPKQMITTGKPTTAATKKQIPPPGKSTKSSEKENLKAEQLRHGEAPKRSAATHAKDIATTLAFPAKLTKDIDSSKEDSYKEKLGGVKAPNGSDGGTRKYLNGTQVRKVSPFLFVEVYII
jgi:hypothetical protein